MPKSISITEVKANLSKLGKYVAKGEEIIITRHSRPYIKMVPLTTCDKPRVLGTFKNKITIHESFYEPASIEFLNAFYGGEVPNVEE